MLIFALVSPILTHKAKLKLGISSTRWSKVACGSPTSPTPPIPQHFRKWGFYCLKNGFPKTFFLLWNPALYVCVRIQGETLMGSEFLICHSPLRGFNLPQPGTRGIFPTALMMLNVSLDSAHLKWCLFLQSFKQKEREGGWKRKKERDRK